MFMIEATLPRPEVGERRVPAAVVYVGKHRVPLRERAAPAVLPAEADGSAAVEQRREREVLAGGPIERLVPSAVGEMRALLEQLADLVVWREVRRNARRRAQQLAQLFHRHRRRYLGRVGVRTAAVLRP